MAAMASAHDEVRITEENLRKAKSHQIFQNLEKIVSSRITRSHPPPGKILRCRYGQNQTTNLQPEVLSLKAFVVLLWYLKDNEIKELACDVDTLRSAGRYIQGYEKFTRLPKYWWNCYEAWVKGEYRALAFEFRQGKL
jgi:hypothetical protein